MNDKNFFCKIDSEEFSDAGDRKIQLGNDQEMAQPERNSHSINLGVGKN